MKQKLVNGRGSKVKEVILGRKPLKNSMFIMLISVLMLCDDQLKMVYSNDILIKI